MVLATNTAARASICGEPPAEAAADASEESRHVVRYHERRTQRDPQHSASAGNVGADRADARVRHRRRDDWLYVRRSRLAARPAGGRPVAGGVGVHQRPARIESARACVGAGFSRLSRPEHDAREDGGHARWSRGADPQWPVANAERDVRDRGSVREHGPGAAAWPRVHGRRRRTRRAAGGGAGASLLAGGIRPARKYSRQHDPDRPRALHDCRRPVAGD